MSRICDYATKDGLDFNTRLESYYDAVKKTKENKVEKYHDFYRDYAMFHKENLKVFHNYEVHDEGFEEEYEDI